MQIGSRGKTSIAIEGGIARIETDDPAYAKAARLLAGDPSSGWEELPSPAPGLSAFSAPAKCVGPRALRHRPDAAAYLPKKGRPRKEAPKAPKAPPAPYPALPEDLDF